MIKSITINNKKYINISADVKTLVELGMSQKDAKLEVSKANHLNKIKNLNTQKQKEISSLSATAKKNVVIDADAESIDNIKTALLALDDGEETMWLTVENKPVKLKKEDLKNALRDIGQKTSEIVFRYRKLKDELLKD